MRSLRHLFGRSGTGITVGSWLAVVLAFSGAIVSLIFILYYNVQVALGTTGSNSWTAVVSDPRHVQSLVNSTVLAILIAVTLTVLSGAVALVFRWCDLTGHRVIYVLAIVPLLLPDQVVGVVGRAVLDPSAGLLARMVPQNLLIDRWMAIALVATLVILKWAPAMIAIADSSILALGQTLQQQIELDFTSFWSAIRVVYLRQMAPVLLIIASLGVLVGFRQHELAYELTSGGAGFQAETWSYWNYRVLFSFTDLASAAVQALVVLGVLLLPITVIRRQAKALWK